MSAAWDTVVVMCRLFGLNAGDVSVRAKYWLLSAPDSMKVQAERNTSGAGIGWFNSDSEPMLVKRPGPADDSPELGADAEAVSAHTLVTHVRMATAGSETMANTHPFLVDGMLIAHNGGFGDLAAVDAELGVYAEHVKGETDSERYAWLIAKETAANDGDVSAGITAAASWLSQNVPMYSLNVVVIKGGWLWALRYPDERALHLARRVVPAVDGDTPDTTWSGSSTLANHQIAADGDTNIVVVASERIDGSDNWRMLEPGELVAVDPRLTVTASLALQTPPKQLLKLAERDPNDEAF